MNSQLPNYLRRMGVPFLVVVLTLIAYVPVYQAGFIWDDESYVENNLHLRSLDGLWTIWTHIGATKQYYPLVFTSFWAEWHLYQLNPLGYHLNNVLLHISASLLLIAVLRRLRIPGAQWAGLIFALHPVHVESVAWVTERKNVLSLCLELLAALAYFQFAPPDDDEINHADFAAENAANSFASRRWIWYALATLFFILGLMSKTIICTLPASLLLLAWWKRDRITKRDVLPVLPWLAIGAAMGMITSYCEKKFVGAHGPEFAFSPMDRLLIAGRAIWFYAGKLLFPYELIFNYPRWQIDDHAPWQYLFPLAALVVLLLLIALRKTISRGPATAALYFCGTLVPALGFVNVWPMRYSFVADHFQYHASIGLIALAAVGIAWIFEHIKLQHRPIVACFMALLIFTLAGTTWSHSRIFHDREKLYLETLALNPDAWMPHNNLAAYYLDKKMPGEAIPHLLEVLRIRGSGTEVQFNLGLAYANMGNEKLAEEHFRLCLSTEKPPAFVNEHLADALAKQGKIDEAIQLWCRSWKLSPESFDGALRLGNQLSYLQRHNDALMFLQKAVSMQPDSDKAEASLGKVLMKLNRPRDAATHLQRAVELGNRDENVRNLLEQATQ